MKSQPPDTAPPLPILVVGLAADETNENRLGRQHGEQQQWRRKTYVEGDLECPIGLHRRRGSPTNPAMSGNKVVSEPPNEKPAQGAGNERCQRKLRLSPTMFSFPDGHPIWP